MQYTFTQMAEKGKKVLENMSKVSVQQALDQIFKLADGSRRTKIWTGPGGYDLFQECMEKDGGFERIYMSKKPPRFMKSKFRRSATGRYYVLLKIAP